MNLHLGGLTFPYVEEFSWIGETRQAETLYLQYDNNQRVPVEVTLLPDPGDQVSDEELLLSLLPAVEGWEFKPAMRVEDVEREVFGRVLKGKRRSGTPKRLEPTEERALFDPYEDPPKRREPVWQEVFIDRHQGVLRVLLLDGPAAVYQDAEPLLASVLAAVLPDGDSTVLDCRTVSAEARAALTDHVAGPMHLALPEKLTGGVLEEGRSWAWNGPYGADSLTLTALPLGDRLWATLAREHVTALNQQGEYDALADLVGDTVVEPHSLVAIAGGRALPGYVSSIESIPVAAVGFTIGNVSYILKSQTLSTEHALQLIREALTTLEFEASDSDK